MCICGFALCLNFKFFNILFEDFLMNELRMFISSNEVPFFIYLLFFVSLSYDNKLEMFWSMLLCKYFISVLISCSSLHFLIKKYLINSQARLVRRISTVSSTLTINAWNSKRNFIIRDISRFVARLNWHKRWVCRSVK